MVNQKSYRREVIDVKFWGRLFGRIAIVLLMVGSTFAYEAPQFMFVALAVAGSAIALSMQRYREHLLGRPEEDSAGSAPWSDARNRTSWSWKSSTMIGWPI